MQDTRSHCVDKAPGFGAESAEGRSQEVSDAGCYLIENAGFADISIDDTGFGSGDRSFVCLNNNTMKLELRSKGSPIIAKHILRSGVDLPFVRGIISSFKNRSTSSVSSVESELEGYCGFPVDDDLFEPQSSNSASILGDGDSSNSAPDNSPRIPAKESNHLRSQGESSSDGSLQFLVESTGAPMGELAITPESCDLPPDPPKYQRSPLVGGRIPGCAMRQSPEKRRSYYVPGDDISPDPVFDNPPPAWDDPPRDFCSPPGYSLPDMQPSEVWGEVGPDGGILQLPGAGVSFHLFPVAGTDHSGLFKAKRKEELDLIPPEILPTVKEVIDRRVVLGLEDPPEMINDKNRIAVGSMVCVDYGNSKLVSHGAVLQVDVNATLKENEQDTLGVECKYSCLIACSSAGPFEEVTAECYQYGSTLQIAILAEDIVKIADHSAPGGSIRLVPIVKVTEKSDTSLCVWDGISSLMVWAAVYGPKRAQWFSTCCVSVSTSTTCPPTLSIKRNSKGVLLHLWTAYRVGITEPQGIKVFLRAGSTSTASTFPTESIIAENELKKKPRINKLFTLKYAKDERSSPTDDSVFQRNDELCTDQLRPKRNERFQLTLVGTKAGMLMEMRFIAPVRSPSWSTPVKRWKKNVFLAPPRASTDGRDRRGQDYLYLWHDAQREASSKLRPPFDIPGAQRQICISHLAVAVTSRVRGKRRKHQSSLLSEYEQSDIMAVLSQDTLSAHGTARYKEWYVGYSRGRPGLIHTQCVRIFKTDRCYNKGNGRITAAQLIESIIEPVGKLCFCFNALREKLLSHIQDWVLLSSVLRFGENYVARVAKEISDNSKREIEDKLSLFLEKFKEYCMAGPHKRSVPKDIIRALLYMEEYELVRTLIVDFCVLSVSVKVGKEWEDMKSSFETVDSKSHPTSKTKYLRVKQRKRSSTSEVTDEDAWVPAFDWLSSVRKEFSSDERAFLVRLHKAVDGMPDSPNRTWTTFTGALVLLFCIDSLSKHETIL